MHVPAFVYHALLKADSGGNVLEFGESTQASSQRRTPSRSEIWRGMRGHHFLVGLADRGRTAPMLVSGLDEASLRQILGLN